MPITLIYGNAGCGKTHKLCEMINKVYGKYNIMILTFTHSSLKNLHNRLQHIDNTHFSTFHSFFRIDYINDIVRGSINNISTYEYIFVDECFMLNKSLFNRCLGNYKHNLILSGDICQLGYPLDKNNMMIPYNDLSLLYNTIRTKINILGIDEKYIMDDIINIIMKIYSMPIPKHINTYIHLTSNFRSDDNITSFIHDIENDTLDENNIKHIDNIYSLCQYLRENNNVVFIASNYNILQSVYDSMYGYDNECVMYQFPMSRVKRVYLKPNMRVHIDGESNKHDYVYIGNEDNDISLDCKRNNLLFKNEINNELYIIDSLNVPSIDILPQQLITYHKSQGLGYDDVVLCVDDVFDISMLYTGITRARHNITFYSKECISDWVKLIKSLYHSQSLHLISSIIQSISISTLVKA